MTYEVPFSTPYIVTDYREEPPIKQYSLSVILSQFERSIQEQLGRLAFQVKRKLQWVGVTSKAQPY